MTDPWAGVGPSVVTSVITSVVTVAIAGILSRNASRRAALRLPLSLHQGVGHVWRLQNDSNRKMRGLEYAVADEDGDFKVQVQSPGDLARKSYLHLEGIELGDTVLVA